MKKASEAFERIYPHDEMQMAFCPYRICPIGAHSDTQYGRVTGMALDYGIYVAFSPLEDGMIELSSLNFTKKVSFSLYDVPIKQNDWADYLRGAVLSLKRKHTLTQGMRAVISGSLPIGGLSSSAAVIIAFLSALLRVNEIRLSAHEMISTALWAENEYVGVSCGKLDQSCEVLCKKDHLIYLDTLDDSYELIPTPEEMRPFEIAIFFSGVERTLVGSKFNVRVDELKAASYALKGFSGLEYGMFEESRLRDVPHEIYDAYRTLLPENWRKRAEHWYSEQVRVIRGAEAWRCGDLEEFGRLSFESGRSSIENYQAGSPELISLYEIMLHTDGIYGGRFSGAGFKGCCMALIDPSYKESIKRQVEKEYLTAFPNLKGKFSVHFCKSANGVCL